MMSDRDLAKRFGKSSLLAVAEELEIDISESTRVPDIVAAIRSDMETNGIIDGEVSDVMYDVMIAMEFIDQEGNIPEDQLAESKDLPEEEEPQDEAQTDRPKCFGWGDPKHDPACARCKVGTACHEHTMSTTVRQLPCWGQYEADADECTLCILWRMCKEVQ